MIDNFNFKNLDVKIKQYILCSELNKVEMFVLMFSLCWYTYSYNGQFLFGSVSHSRCPHAYLDPANYAKSR